MLCLFVQFDRFAGEFSKPLRLAAADAGHLQRCKQIIHLFRLLTADNDIQSAAGRKPNVTDIIRFCVYAAQSGRHAAFLRRDAVQLFHDSRHIEGLAITALVCHIFFKAVCGNMRQLLDQLAVYLYRRIRLLLARIQLFRLRQKIRVSAVWE